MKPEPKRSFWVTPNGLATIILIVAVVYFLLTEHRAHTITVLPWLFILLCPLMHVFMHWGHGHGGSGHDEHRHENDRQERE